jgi:hypothetical protein
MLTYKDPCFSQYWVNCPLLAILPNPATKSQGAILTNYSVQSSPTHSAGESGLQVFLSLRKKKTGSLGIKELRQMNGNNFADKRDKGFPFFPSSIASLHGSSANCERKKVIFTGGYFSKRIASDPFNTDKHTVTESLSQLIVP